MNLSPEECHARFVAHDHAVMCTVHVDGGLHAAPCAFAVVDGHVGIPVDLVKPKKSTRLIVQRNLEADPTAALVVERYDHDDWSQLWWVRASLHHVAEPDAALVDALADALEARYVQYRGQPFVTIIVLRIDRMVGWSGAAGTVPQRAPA